MTYIMMTFITVALVAMAPIVTFGVCRSFLEVQTRGAICFGIIESNLADIGSNFQSI
jgi:hypothetical protein